MNPTLVARLVDQMPGDFSFNGQASAAERRDLSKAAVDSLSRRQKNRASNSPVGVLGAKSGRDHHTEISDGYRWSSCAPVRMVLNTSGAPKGAVRDFGLAVSKIRQATGLDLVVVGTTDASPDEDWAHSDGQDTWNPVLVSWGKEGTGVLNEGASATTAPLGVTNDDGQGVWVSGQMRFSTQADYIYTPGFGSYGSRVLLYMHELGHLVGLDHVQDINQMMFPTVSGAVDAGAGDMAGLRQSGDAGCLTAPSPDDVF